MPKKKNFPEETAWYVGYSVVGHSGSPFVLPGPNGNFEFEREIDAKYWLRAVKNNHSFIPHIKANKGHEIYCLKVYGEYEFWSECGTMDTASDHLATDKKVMDGLI